MTHRAIFNTLRMHWLRDPGLPVEKWQVEDYRSATPEQLFAALEQKGILLDRVSFIALAEESESPEELTTQLAQELKWDDLRKDQVYLILFELWRRWVPEKQTLSIFCDELDHQIDLYEREQITDSEPIQDAIANLIVILDENCDEGQNPQEIFASISRFSAHDLESFLYDFLTDLIDSKDLSYANELLEDVMPYVKEKLWFLLLKARILLSSDHSEGYLLLKQLIQASAIKHDVEWNLGLLSAMIRTDFKDQFQSVVMQTFPLLKTEGEFQDLLAICAESLHYLDEDQKESEVQKILKNRSHIALESRFDPKEFDAKTLSHLLS